MNYKELYLQDIDTLKHYGEQFLDGTMSKMDFKKHSGGLGVYAEDCGTRFMTRLRIPSGILSPALLKMIYSWAQNYGLGGFHFTTRQTIQFHNLTLDQTIELLKTALDVGITTKGAGGNYPRNVAVSPLSGVTPNEPFDVTSYSLLVGNYFAQHMPNYHLPRKLKVSFSNTLEDTGHASFQDMGFIATRHNDQPYFKLYIGGNLGRNPKQSLLYPELIPATDILYYVEAIVQLFIAEGDYENKHKARISYIVDRLGDEGFIECFKSHVQKAFDTLNLKCVLHEHCITKTGSPTHVTSSRLFAQKQEGLYSVYVHPVGGQITLTDVATVLESLEGLESIEIRLAMEESFYIVNLTGEEAEKLLDVTKSMTGDTQMSFSVACIGKPTCQMGILQSQKLLNNILNHLNEKGCTEDILPSIHISGCPNSCGTHQITPIGFMGKKKRVDDVLCNVYECFVNGKLGEEGAELGTSIGDIKEDDIPQFMCWLYEQLSSSDMSFTDWLNGNLEVIKDKFIV